MVKKMNIKNSEIEKKVSQIVEKARLAVVGGKISNWHCARMRERYERQK